MSSPNSQQGGQPRIRQSMHGFFSYDDEIEELHESHECTIFVTDAELLIGDQGAFKPLGGLMELLPGAVAGIANKVLADDQPTTISYDTAVNRPGTKRIPLTNIAEIEVEKGIPPIGKHLVEITHGNGNELAIYIGTADSYGGKEETKAFVDALEAAATDAGGAPRVTQEFDL